MSLFVEMVFNLLDGKGNGAVTALLLQTFKAGENALGEKGLFLFDGFDILVLLLLFQIPPVNGEHKTEDNAQSGYNPGNSSDEFHFYLLNQQNL